MDEIEYVELYPKIYLYKNLLKDVDNLYKIMKDSEKQSNGKYHLKKWEQWSLFGTYTQSKNETYEAEHGEINVAEKYLADSVSEAYSKAVEHYIQKNNIDLPEGSHLASSS